MSQTVPIDKQAHFWAGMAIVALLLPFFGPWAMVAGVLAGAAKELRDQGGAGTYDPRDFWATVAGGVAAGLAHALMFFVFTTIATATP